MKELTVIAKDRIGLLADVSEALGKNGINIEAISVETGERTAVVRIVTKKPVEAKKTLTEAGFKVLDTNVLVVRMPNKPGQLAKVTRVLAEKGINLQRVYLIGREGTYTLVGMETNTKDFPHAKTILKHHSVTQ